ncbi:MAG TPA: LacI family DNA-binding transcriptional regulator [Chloroflexota bacterium]|nr:LacI family DNA-binding transcriptional regulator [Chloroflexota bacterium]
MTRLTIEEIAELAAVSRSTVSRVINDHPGVRSTVRARVLQVIQEHHYAPRAAARSLASSRTNAVGLLIPGSTSFIFSDAFFPQVIQGISETCNTHGYILMLSTVTPEMEHDFYERVLRGHHVDGVIVMSSNIDDPVLPLLIHDPTPLVLVGRHPYLRDLNSVDVENREGALAAVRHLIGLGHSRIGTITGPLHSAAALDRRDGYKQALVEASLAIRPELIALGDFTQDGGRLAMRALLELAEPPTAVFVASDTMASGALQAARELEVRVPEDVSLVSFDDLPIASLLVPSLTTVHQPLYDLGAAAADLLLKRLDGPEAPPEHVWLPTQLVIRQSSAAAALPRAG